MAFGVWIVEMGVGCTTKITKMKFLQFSNITSEITFLLLNYETCKPCIGQGMLDHGNTLKILEWISGETVAQTAAVHVLDS